MHDATKFLEQEQFNYLRIEVGQIIISKKKKFVLQLDKIFWCKFQESLLFECAIYMLLEDNKSYYLHQNQHNYTIEQLINITK